MAVEKVYQYRLWCNDESAWVYAWAPNEIAPTVCPNNTTHITDPEKTSIVNQISNIEVEISNLATIQDPTLDVQRVAIQPGRSGYYMCDRDVLIKTSVVDDTSFEDLKVDTATNVREEWGEISLMGCYKSDGAGGYTLCTSQAEADSTAVASVWQYLANDQSITPSEIDIDLKGGCFFVDPILTGDIWSHQLYAVLAPNIPSAFGGSIRFFDSYLYPHQGVWLTALNTLALKVDPTITPEAAKLKVWVFYPPGAKQSHVLRLVTYRPMGSF